MALTGRPTAREALFYNPHGALGATDAHLHTTFTDGEMTVPEALEAAAAQNLQALAFTDHARAESTYVPEYRAAIRRQRDRYPFPVYIGLEVKMTDFTGGTDLPLGQELDLVLVSLHRFPKVDGGFHHLAPATAAEAAESELRATLGVIAAQTADVISHPTRIYCTFYKEPFPAAYLEEIAQAAARHHVALELNARNPNWREILAACRAAGAAVTLGSDAHRAAEVGLMWRLFSGQETEATI